MDAMQLCEVLLMQTLNTERFQRWSAASHRIARLLPKHSILMLDLQEIGRLDCLVCELERGMAQLIQTRPANPPAYAPGFCLLLAKAWLSLTYEALRTIKQRLLSNSDLHAHWNDQIDRVFSDFERVRMGELKREIAKGGKLSYRVEMFVPGDETATLEEYQHGRTILNSPTAWRPTDGSAVWHSFNPDLRRSEELYRHDMSRDLLFELEKM